MALPFFAITLFVCAFLLFLVQPMIGKMILLPLGGTPQVWNTCMVFFQMALLAGYAYSHTVASRLKLRQQLIFHGALLLLPFLVLLPLGPFNIRGLNWNPPPGANPIPWALEILTLMVGLPFLVVATSAPLLQRWFSFTGHPAAKDPYFLYGASNLGSMLSLICYPFLIEPYLGLYPFYPDNPDVARFLSQPWIWTFGYMLMVALVMGCAAMVWTAPPSVHLPMTGGGGGRPATEPAPAPHQAHPETQPQVQPQPPPQPDTGVKAGAPGGPGGGGGGKGSTAIKKGSKQKGQPKGTQLRPQVKRDLAPTHEDLARLDNITSWRRVRWVLLAAIPSSLMLGVTSYITTDLSPIPLFWLIPLILYLLSFILVFLRWPILWTGQPHTAFLVIQPWTIGLLLLYSAFGGGTEIIAPIVINVLAFFCTTMVCHGELAKDRPGTKHLTEFYLWMSVGGMLGGMFNGLVAPVLFYGLAEFPLAIIAACLVRPAFRDDDVLSRVFGGWLDTMFAGAFAKTSEGGGRHARKGQAEETETMHYTLDVVVAFAVLILVAVLTFGLRGTVASMFARESRGESGLAGAQFIIFGLPLLIACLFLARPLRFGLAIAGIILVHTLYVAQADKSIYSDRSYFGILRVKESVQDITVGPDKEGKYVPISEQFVQLIHGHINHGMNFRKPSDRKLWGNPQRDFSRLATTYYHRKGPAGVVMEQYCWFHEPMNWYNSDARMPASLIGLGAGPLGTLTPFPAEQMVALWSEPPYATIGLGTGTMASYSRPFQHMHYYEIDNHIKRLSLPRDGEPKFTYLRDAQNRGAEIWVMMGDARLKMAQPYVGGERFQDWRVDGSGPVHGGGPDNFYFMMVVDAFTSDAIPVHLITREAIAMYFTKLAPQGILCVHTSNRYVNLVPVVADVAASLNLVSLRGHDMAPKYSDVGTKNAPAVEDVGHFTSEWVMVARTGEDLKRMEQWTPADYKEKMEAQQRAENVSSARIDPYWEPPEVRGRNVWTDDYSNLMAVFRGH